MGEPITVIQQNLIQHYEKSPDYRTVFATGIFGGPTINGLLCVNFIIDRPPIPLTTESAPDATGMRLTQIGADFGGKIAIREIQCAIVMNTDTAKLVIEQLTTQVKAIEDAQPK